MERLTILWQINRQSKPQPSSVWFSRNQFGFAEKTFFLVFTYFWGQIPKILAKVSTDFVQQTCTYMEFNLGEDAYGQQRGNFSPVNVACNNFSLVACNNFSLVNVAHTSKKVWRAWYSLQYILTSNSKDDSKTVSLQNRLCQMS